MKIKADDPKRLRWRVTSRYSRHGTCKALKATVIVKQEDRQTVRVSLCEIPAPAFGFNSLLYSVQRLVDPRDPSSGPTINEGKAWAQENIDSIIAREKSLLEERRSRVPDYFRPRERNLYLRYLGCLNLLSQCSVKLGHGAESDELRVLIGAAFADACRHHPLKCRRTLDLLEIAPVAQRGW